MVQQHNMMYHQCSRHTQQEMSKTLLLISFPYTVKLLKKVERIAAQVKGQNTIPCQRQNETMQKNASKSTFPGAADVCALMDSLSSKSFLMQLCVSSPEVWYLWHNQRD